MNPFRTLRVALTKFRLKRKWRKLAKRRQRVVVRVSSPIKFLKDLDQHGIEACVLRWPNEVPDVALRGRQNKKAIDETYGDVDVLISITKLNDLLPIAAQHTHAGGVKCELYSVMGIKGTQFMRYPYYPPLRGLQLMVARQRHSNGFYCLSGREYILSLVYHLVYHKSLASGIPISAESGAQAASDNKYSRRLRAEAEREGVTLPSPITLENLERWLCENEWQMPFDLLLRWPVRDEWIRHLESQKAAQLSQAENQKYEFVYFLREDIENTPLEAVAENLLAQKFEITQTTWIPPELRKEIGLWLRGGSWGEGKGRKLILPYKCILCVDHQWTQPTQVNELYPHVDNERFFYKHEIRKELCAAAGRKIYGIHGSDNALEARYMKSIWRKFIDEQKPARVI